MATHKTYLDIWWNKGTKHIGLLNYKEPWKQVGNKPLWGNKNKWWQKKKWRYVF